ncbi:MAG: PilT/PilU family type 4a pilus ATPase [Bacilli bacterium]|nr:PilT/PilU family type 4a pilus ATPase [Bacilli bacterium]
MVDVEKLLKEAVEKEASDIFIVAGSPYAFKIHGEIKIMGDQRLMPEDCKEIIAKIYDYSPYNSMDTYLETGDDDFSFPIPNVGRFRVNVYRQRNSQAAVLRVVRFDLPKPEDYNIPAFIVDLYKVKKGMILISGSAGSGKSTTLACIIDKINETRNAHIITIEDPIEFLHSHKKSIVSQREILHDTQGYLQALRAALRETPEVILLGEMRDSETITTALTAAETGHLLFSTLHTVGAANTIDRIIDAFATNQQQIRTQLSMVLHAVVSEQLLPAIDGSVVPAFEIMIVNPAIRSQIRDGKTYQIDNTIASNRESGMITMDDSIYKLYEQKKISADTAVLYSSNPEQMKKRCH